MKRVHIIGVAGKATVPIAIALKQLGWQVSGSDEDVFEPAPTLLNKYGVTWYEGFEASHVEGSEIVVVGGAVLLKNPQNPEYIKAKELNIKLMSFPELLNEVLIKPTSVVICGNYGKTTTTSMTTWMLENAGFNPSYMIGGEAVNFELGVRLNDSNYSVIEGDEFVSAFNYDMNAKFMHYNPTIALLSSTQHDHIDAYPTEELYIKEFIKLAKLVESNNGKFVVCASGHNNEKVVAEYKGALITYMVEGHKQVVPGSINYSARLLKFNETGTAFEVWHNEDKLGEFTTQMIGEPNVENCLGTIAIANELGIGVEKIQEGITTFKGVKRRQEIRGYSPSGATIMEDFAHSAIKAKSTLEGLRTRYKGKIIAIYSPRISNLSGDAILNEYRGAFELADIVIIPKVMVKKSTDKSERIHGKDLADAVSNGRTAGVYLPKNEQIVDYINKNASAGTLVVFMSAGGWGDLIEKTING
ncbi:MAG: UDP-N-acetylmuramate:L-alanyl-gamma-D-glutamyl-me so-diaminopimelate ligase [Candidatus Dojkabacteria bacterium]